MNKFLQLLFRKISVDQFIELRCIPLDKDSGERPIQKFFKIDELTKLESEALQHDKAQLYHTCIGVLPRDSRSGVANQVSTMQVAWIDIDAKDISLENLYKHIESFKLKPSIVVASGNGFHCYWILDQSYKLYHDGIKDIISKLHKITKADKTFDAARVLRLPGTRNYKDMSHIKLCNVSSFSGLVYTLEDIQHWIETEEKIVQDTAKIINSQVNIVAANSTVNVPNFNSWGELKERLSSFLQMRIMELPLHLRDEHGQKLDRSRNDFYVAASLMELGYTSGQIKMAFEIFKENGFAAGAKYSEQGDTYLLDHTIPNVQRAVKANIFQLFEELRTSLEEVHALKCVDGILNIIKNTRAVQYMSRLESMTCAKIEWMTKKEFEKYAEEQISGKGAYVFETFKVGKKPTVIHKKIAEAVISDNPYIKVGAEAYRYEKGVFKVDEQLLQLQAHIWAITENRPVGSIAGIEYVNLSDRTWIDLKQKDISEICSYVLQNAPNLDPNAPPIDPELICVKNGMVNLLTGDLEPHHPKYLRLAQLDVKYNPRASLDTLDKFMMQTFHSDDIDVIWEYMGVALSENYTAKKFMIFVGAGDNGKSVWLNVTRNVLGINNVSSATLEDLASNRFAKSQLFGKLANIASDISANHLMDISAIKELTGNDQTSADRKFQSQLNFVNTASLIFSCNILPEATTADDAYFKRLMIIDCFNQVPENKQDKMLEKKLTTDTAKSAWLNNALEGLRRFLKQKNTFSKSETIAAAVENHKKDCRPDMAFVERYITMKPENELTLDIIMRDLKEYVRATSTSMIPSKAVVKALMAKNFPAYTLRASSNGTPSYRGLAINSELLRTEIGGHKNNSSNESFVVNFNTTKKN